MDFIAHDLWSGVYVIALIIAGLATIKGRNTDERRVLHIMVANWLAVRTIVTFLNYNETAFMASAIFAVVALAIYAKTDAAKVCAILFFAILQFDILDRIGVLSFNGAAEIQDAIGFAILLIMAGAANDFWTGKRFRLPDLFRNRISSTHSVLAVRRNASQSPDVVDTEN